MFLTAHIFKRWNQYTVVEQYQVQDGWSDTDQRVKEMMQCIKQKRSENTVHNEEKVTRAAQYRKFSPPL